MEKYRQFADGGTGVNPFVPLWSHHKAPLALKAVKALVMLPVALLRLAVLVLALLWLGLGELLCAVIPVGMLRYPLYRIISYPGCALALVALGVFPVGDSLSDHRRLKIAPPKSSGSSVFDARHGTVVLANQQGLTDVLFLGMRLCPTFVFLAGNGAPVQCSLLGALKRASTRRPPAPLQKAKSLAELAEWARAGWHGPLVVFPEGSRTNGSSILAWKAETFTGAAPFECKAGTALTSLEYSKAGAYTAHHTVGTAFRHIIWLCLQPWQTLRSQWLPAPIVATAIKGKPATEQAALLRTLLTRMTPGAVEVDVTFNKHFDFMAFWDASQRKGYTQKKAA